jgi:prophage antirepressor-like protein
VNTFDLIPYLFETDTVIRSIMRDGEPWFIVADIGPITGLKNPSDAVRVLAPHEKDVITIGNSDTPLGKTEGSTTGLERVIVSESGLYALILRSNAAMKEGTKAYRFRLWVTADLLPTIRKTGSYGRPVPAAAPEELSVKLKMAKIALAIRCGQSRSGAEMWIRTLGFEPLPSLVALLNQQEFSFMVDLDETPPTAAEAVN